MERTAGRALAIIAARRPSVVCATRHGKIVDAILVIVDRLSKFAIYEPVPGVPPAGSQADGTSEPGNGDLPAVLD